MWLRVLIAGCMAVAGLVAVGAATPSVAAGSGVLTVSTNGVLYADADCDASQTFSYSLVLPEETSYWAIRFYLRRPDGGQASQGLATSDDAPVSGSRELNLCGRGWPEGTYTLVADGYYYAWSEGHVKTTLDIPPVSFEMRQAGERLTMTSSVRPDWAREVYLATVKFETTRETPTGYQPVVVDLDIEYQDGLKWRRLRESDGSGYVQTDEAGKGTLRFEWPIGKSVTLRAKWNTFNIHTDWYSDPATIEPPAGPSPFPKAQGWFHKYNEDKIRYHIDQKNGYVYFWMAGDTYGTVGLPYEKRALAIRNATPLLRPSAKKPLRVKFKQCGIKTEVTLYPSGWDTILPAWKCR